MKKIQVILAHPNFENSRLNKALFNGIQGMQNVESFDLYKTYPEYKFDVEKEQSKLLNTDILVLQFPFYWYTSPALLKKWFDDILLYNFAYGPEGNKLKNKSLVLAITTGGNQQAYSREGYNYFNIEELLTPFMQTARLCGLNFLPAFLVQGANVITDAELEQKTQEYKQLLLELSK